MCGYVVRELRGDSPFGLIRGPMERCVVIAGEIGEWILR